MSIREVTNSPFELGSRESRKYTLDTTEWGGGSTGAACSLIDLTTDLDVSSTKLSGSVVANANTIVTKTVDNLVAGHHYRLNITWSNSSGEWEAYLIIVCTE